MDRKISMLAVCGSLRAGSYNAALLRAAAELAPSSVEIVQGALREIPLYDEDVRAQGSPASVERLRAQVAEADGLLLASPEYNYSFSGVLKNAIDWVSRPPDQAFKGKPIAIVSTSSSALGGARAQYHLRQCFIYLDARLMSQPEFMMGQATQKIDAGGKLTDPASREHLKAFVAAFAAWIGRVRNEG